MVCGQQHVANGGHRLRRGAGPVIGQIVFGIDHIVLFQRFVLQHIHRNLNVDRAAVKPPAGSDRRGHIARKVFNPAAAACPFGQRLHDADRVILLKGFCQLLPDSRGAANQHDGGGYQFGVNHRRHRVGDSRACRGDDNPHFPAGLGIGHGRIGCTHLIAHVVHMDSLLFTLLKDAENMPTAQGENTFNPSLFQHFGCNYCAVNSCHESYLHFLIQLCLSTLP